MHGNSSTLNGETVLRYDFITNHAFMLSFGGELQLQETYDAAEW